jgi:hypothetical protein
VSLVEVSLGSVDAEDLWSIREFVGEEFQDEYFSGFNVIEGSHVVDRIRAKRVHRRGQESPHSDGEAFSYIS